MNDDGGKRVVHVNDIPDELLLEIFKWMPVDDLNARVKLVCKRWRKIASTSYLGPRLVVVSKRSNRKKIRHLLTERADTLTTIVFQNVHESGIATVADWNGRWLNLKTVSIKWKYEAVDWVRISVARLIWLTDRCPKLSGIELRECFVYGDVNAFVARIADRRIDRITFLNRYLVVNGVERLFELRDMSVFRVYCYFFGESNARTCIRRFCGNNRRTLTNLGLRLEDDGDGSDDSVDSIVTCTRLRRLQLVGKFALSTRGLARIGELANLRSLKMEVYYIGCEEFAEFLRSPFTRQLYQVAVYWSRRVGRKELAALAWCSNLSRLTVSFVDDFNDAGIVCEGLVQLAGKVPLRKLKVASSFSILDSLPMICANAKDLFRIKLTQRCNLESEGILENKLDPMKGLYEFEYSVNGSELEIVLNKKIVCSEFSHSYFYN